MTQKFYVAYSRPTGHGFIRCTIDVENKSIEEIIEIIEIFVNQSISEQYGVPSEPFIITNIINLNQVFGK